MTDPTPMSATLCDAFQRTAAVAPDTVALRTVGEMACRVLEASGRKAA